MIFTISMYFIVLHGDNKETIDKEKEVMKCVLNGLLLKYEKEKGKQVIIINKPFRFHIDKHAKDKILHEAVGDGLREANNDEIANDLISRYESNSEVEFLLDEFFQKQNDIGYWEKDEYLEAFKTMEGWNVFYKKFPNAAFYIKLSNACFNEGNNIALLFVEVGEGPLSGTRRAYFLKREKGKWRVAKEVLIMRA